MGQHAERPFNLYDEAENLVGTLGYGTYFEGQINGDDDFYGHGYKARYYWIMSGFVSWDNAYTPVAQSESTENALCRVSYSAEASPPGPPRERRRPCVGRLADALRGAGAGERRCRAGAAPPPLPPA